MFPRIFFTIAAVWLAVSIPAQTQGQAPAAANNSPGLRMAMFDIDATPPLATMMAYDPVTNKWDLTLRARGVVLLGAGEPVVLCAVDWIGIANEGHDAFSGALARGAGTVSSRVAVHTLHQHDAPDCDFGAEQILTEAGLATRQFESAFQRRVLGELEQAVRESIPRAVPVTHIGLGEAVVEKVASNRRILGADGKVRAVRYTATTDAALRAEPEGVIDPVVSLVSFWNGTKPVAVLSYYATHPQSYYRTGIPNPDFPGVARFLRQLAVPSALHVHFNGAGGNIGAGKYNDGAPENRGILADRLAEGMRRAWESTKREPITPSDVVWRAEPVALEPSPEMSEEKLLAQMRGRDGRFFFAGGPSKLAWIRRCAAGRKIHIGCLRLGRARILHMPGELFVEYQLAAKSERKDLFITMAAYGDYGPWYIGTAVSYQEGGYESTQPASNVGPQAEPELLRAIRTLLRD